MYEGIKLQLTKFLSLSIPKTFSRSFFVRPRLLGARLLHEPCGRNIGGGRGARVPRAHEVGAYAYCLCDCLATVIKLNGSMHLRNVHCTTDSLPGA